jgi:magnesium chelatase subunit I
LAIGVGQRLIFNLPSFLKLAAGGIKKLSAVEQIEDFPVVLNTYHKPNTCPKNSMPETSPPLATTFGQLKVTGYRSRSVREEIRENLIQAIKAGQALFPGVIGYENTVEPQLISALLARHDILLLGLRGQAKTRLLRSLVQFLDPWMPAIEGSPLREDPLAPILQQSIDLVHAQGDETPIVWIPRHERFVEKLATPDASISDLIGDIDPIRASRERLDLSDPRVIHFGIVPRSHRGIFCINELPDLQPRIQVGLLNILEEQDIQIRGFPIRLKLDVMMTFTANPEDYTNRGRIITPLKDRIASQIITHYPNDVTQCIKIFKQEAQIHPSLQLEVPELMLEILAEISVQARQSDMVDQSSGVSARLSIAAYELLMAQCERRRMLYGEANDGLRFEDIYACVPAISGKLELVFEGQETGAERVAHRLIGQAVKAVFSNNYEGVSLQTKKNTQDIWEQVTGWFNAGNHLTLLESDSRAEVREKLNAIPSLKATVSKMFPATQGQELDFLMAMAIDGLYHYSLLSKKGLGGTIVYGDALSDMMKDFGG